MKRYSLNEIVRMLHPWVENYQAYSKSMLDEKNRMLNVDLAFLAAENRVEEINDKIEILRSWQEFETGLDYGALTDSELVIEQIRNMKLTECQELLADSFQKVKPLIRNVNNNILKSNINKIYAKYADACKCLDKGKLSDNKFGYVNKILQQEINLCKTEINMELLFPGYAKMTNQEKQKFATERNFFNQNNDAVIEAYCRMGNSLNSQNDKRKIIAMAVAEVKAQMKTQDVGREI